jgi:hypothetical protein
MNPPFLSTWEAIVAGIGLSLKFSLPIIVYICGTNLKPKPLTL